MLSPELIASSVVPLLVALFNLLVAGYALTAGFKERSKLAFAAGPAGVGMWALAWFISLFEVSSLEGARTLGTIGALFAMFGFALDALVSVDRRRARMIAGAGAVAFVVLFFAAVFALAPQYEVPIFSFGCRLAALVLAAIVVVVQALNARSTDLSVRALARWMLGVTAMTTVLCVALGVAAVIGDRTFVDPLLLVILLAELYALVYIVRRRVEVRVLLSRAVTYALLSIFVAAIAAFAFAQVGYPVEPVIVAVTVSISLLASALFMGLSHRLSLGVERVLFPEQAKLERALAASKGELRALRRRLERAEKLAIAGELAASVAHEIKNPLSPIRGYAQLLQGKLAAVPAADRAVFEKGLAIIREETDRIDQRVRDLLQASRAERVTASSEESLDLNRVAIEASAVAEGEAGSARIIQRLDATLGRVVGNEDEMRGALLNLIKNAIEAMQSSGGRTVEIVTRREEDKAIVEVIDEGTGVAPKDAEHVFDAFYTTKQGGTGLGLAIARSAVEAAGGTITLADRSDRRGAVARIELDLAGKETIREQEAQA